MTKPLATIKSESGATITLQYEATERALYAVRGTHSHTLGGELLNEEAAISYIYASFSRGWELTWIEAK